MSSSGPICLVLSPDLPKGSEIALQAALVLRYVVSKALDRRFQLITRHSDSYPNNIHGVIRQIASADLVVAIRIGVDLELEQGIGAASASNKLEFVVADEAEGTSFFGDTRDIRVNPNDPMSHDVALERILALLPAQHAPGKGRSPVAGTYEQKREHVSARSEAPDQELSPKEAEMEAATKLIRLMMGREGFSRIAFDNRQGRQLVIYGNKSLDVEGVDSEIDGIPVEVRLN